MKKREKTGYCLKCDTYVPYILKEVVETHYPKDRPLEVKLFRPMCPYCGREVVEPSIEAENNIRIFDEQKKAMGLLTSYEIKAIRKKRRLSQAELARLIGAGEKTITRYEGGTIQDKVFDTLIRLIDDDAAYEALIRLNKNKNINNINVYKLKNY